MINMLTSLRWNDLHINMIGLTGLYICLELLSGWGLIMECFVMYVAGERFRRVGWFHWLAVPWLADSVGGIFVCTWIPNGSFLCFFCMVVLVLVYHLLLHIHVCCLICVLHMLKPGYWFWCSVFSLCLIVNRPAWLPYIGSIACIAFYFIYTAWVCIVCFLC